MKRFLILASLLIPLVGMAEVTPQKGKADPRVRIVKYNPHNVVRLTTFYGVSTHVQFASDETIRNVAVGDDQAWQIVPQANHLFIKPKGMKANTNVTVITDKRIYQFVLIVNSKPISDDKAWADSNLIFSLSFRYPDEDARKAKEFEVREEVENRLVESENAVNKTPAEIDRAATNYDYWVSGSEEISPTAARDDGRFIYLTFSNNRDMPAVYEVGKDGRESLVNTNVTNGNTIVVHRMVSQLMLRKGSLVASVVNKSFDLNGGRDNRTGTVSPRVQRVIKGAR